ncbi:hypothetical protein [Stygiolobus caldivivus]|uniref:Uncharacterized protein n=1 Tax=Stygiolobus caldivivus TaxID=2824673 RepID=A0A8D5U8E6_9CREN|nr:hypothetical protein [Stygiolobus caldivivus]BCU70823.1 hypothetical protein KN1_21200 [Stygiolobus caldivivus]
MAVGEASLSSLISAISAAVGANITLTTQQEQCLKYGLRKYYQLFVQRSNQKYGVYPALASSDRVLKEASNSPEKIFRQGIVVQTTDTGEWYYIGGISKYWTYGNLIVYRGGSRATSQGKLTRGLIDSFVEKTGGLGVVPLYKQRVWPIWYNSERKVPQVWYNPPLLQDCQGRSSLLWDSLSSIEVAYYVAVVSEAPRLLFEILSRGGSLTYSREGDYSLSAAAKDYIDSASDTYPFIYFATATALTVAQALNLKDYPSFTFNAPTAEALSECNDIMPPGACALLGVHDLVNFNDINIGAPVFSVISCGDSCSQFGLIGFVSGYSAVSLKELKVQPLYLNVIPPPSSFTSAAIKEWAGRVGITDLLQKLLEAGEKFRKAVSALSTTFPWFIATAASLYVAWVEVSYEEGLKEAEERAKELKEIYEKVVNELAGKQPPMTEKRSYKKWYKYKTVVEKCVQEVMVDDPGATYEELADETELCIEYSHVEAYPRF